MSSEDPQPKDEGLGKWWYVSAALVFAVVIGAVAVVWSGSRSSSSASPSKSAGAPPAAGAGQPGNSGGDGWSGDRGCAQTPGTGTFDGSALGAVSWQAVGNSSAPGSEVLGPVKVTGPVRQCFQHSPAGALVAAVNIISGLGADHATQAAVAQAQVTAGDWQQQLLAASDDSDSGGGSGAGTVAGYQLGGCEPASCLVNLAMYGQGIYYTVALPMVWQDGDWKLAGQSAPIPGRGMTSIPAGWTTWTP